MMVYPSGLHRRRDLARMGALLGTAAAIVMSTPEAVRRLLAEFPDARRPACRRDPERLRRRGLRRRRRRARTDGTFRIVHTGYLHTELGLQHRRVAAAAACPPRQRPRARHPHALARPPRRGSQPPAGGRPLAPRHDRAPFRGRAHRGRPRDRGPLLGCEAARLRDTRRVDRADAIRRTCSSCRCRTFRPGVRATIVPGKTYEYLASGTTILGAVPEGDARDILEEAGTRWSCGRTTSTGSPRRCGARSKRSADGTPTPRHPPRCRRPLRVPAPRRRARVGASTRY